MARYLIVNADDFGQSEGINRGVIECIEKGIVTSASLMVRWPAAEAAAAYARGANLSLGLHFDLGEWTYEDESWRPLYSVLSEETPETIAAELDDQIDRFVELVGQPPTHIDSHQHIHREEPTSSVLRAAAARLGVPLRDAHPEIRYAGAFYGQSGKGYAVPEAISVDSLVALIHALPEGTTELGCHPGYADSLQTMYRDERTVEVSTLCDPRVTRALEDAQVTLSSFSAAVDRL